MKIVSSELYILEWELTPIINNLAHNNVNKVLSNAHVLSWFKNINTKTLGNLHER